MKKLMIAVALLCATQAMAGDGQRVIGNWYVTSEADRFGDGGTFLAMTGSAGLGLAVRCIKKELSLALLDLSNDPKPLATGDVFALKLRTDKQPIREAFGKAISERLIQIPTDKDAVRSIRDGAETAVRIETTRDVVTTNVFKTRGARQAFADLVKECPLE